MAVLAASMSATVALADAAGDADAAATLFAFNGEAPAPLPPDDDIRQSVGALFIDGVAPEQYDRNHPAYATAFLVSDCHVIARQTSLFPLAEMTKNEQGFGTLEGLRFGLAPHAGATGAKLSQSDFERSWPAVVVPEVSGGMQKMDLKYGPWKDWLLFRLADCTPGTAPQVGTLLPMTSAELSAQSDKLAVRHVGLLDGASLAVVADTDCRLFGLIDGPTWRTDCTSWLGMSGGPVQIFDEGRKRWVTVGMMSKSPYVTSVGTVDNQRAPADWAVQSVDLSDPLLFQWMPEVIPMSTIWPMIADEISEDQPRLAEGADADAEEPEFDLKQAVAQLREHAWSGDRAALHATSVAVGLIGLGQRYDAMLWYFQALKLDPDFRSAALLVAPLLEAATTKDIADADLQRMASTLDTAIKAEPNSLSLLQARMIAERRLAKFDDVLADADRYLAAGGGTDTDRNWIFSRRGYANSALGKLDEAVADYQKAIAANSSDADTERELAKVLLQQGHPDQAKPHARAAIRIDSRDPSNHLVLGLAMLYGGDADRALEEIEDAHKWGSKLPTYALWEAAVAAYQQSLTGAIEMPLLTKSDVDGTFANWWPYPAAEVFMGQRDVDSLQTFDFADYTPDDRRLCGVGRTVFTAVYQAALGRPIDHDKLKTVLEQHRDLTLSLLIPIVDSWGRQLTMPQ